MVVASPQISLAATAAPTCTETKLCAIPVRVGDKAPYDGQLLGTRLAITLGQLADACDQRLRLEQTHCDDLARIEKTRSDGILASERDAYTDELKSLQERLARAQQLAVDAEPPFYAKPWFVGPVVAIGTAAAVAWAAKR